jgi:predicted nucleic acid-binding protein
MTDSSPTRIYPDTNILVSYSLGDSDENFGLAEKLFEEVQNNKYKMVVSNFTLMETLHALRTIITRMKYQELDNSPSQNELIQIANSKTFQETVYEESMKAFSTIIDKITKDKQHFSFEPDGLTYPNETFATGLQLMMATKGSFRVYRFRCQKCNSYTKCSSCREDSEIVLKEANAPDMVHLLISERLECKVFFTMDKYFANIPTKDARVKIEVLTK